MKVVKEVAEEAAATTITPRSRFDRFGGVKPREVIERIAANDPELVKVELSANATFQVRVAPTARRLRTQPRARMRPEANGLDLV